MENSCSSARSGFAESSDGMLVTSHLEHFAPHAVHTSDVCSVGPEMGIYNKMDNLQQSVCLERTNFAMDDNYIRNNCTIPYQPQEHFMTPISSKSDICIIRASEMCGIRPTLDLCYKTDNLNDNMCVEKSSSPFKHNYMCETFHHDGNTVASHTDKSNMSNVIPVTEVYHKIMNNLQEVSDVEKTNSSCGNNDARNGSDAHSKGVETSVPQNTQKPNTCKICHETFYGKGALKTHSLVHKVKQSFECNICNKSFGKKETLKNHHIVHTGEKPFKCDVCHKSFSQQGSLYTHRQTHSGIKPFVCDVCHKSFTQKGTLKTHALIHSGEKPYQCDICSKSFNQKENWKRHYLVHSGEKQYECKICNKSFAYKFYLKEHILIHSDDKPYKCDICVKSFVRIIQLKSHLKVHNEGKQKTGKSQTEKLLQKKNDEALGPGVEKMDTNELKYMCDQKTASEKEKLVYKPRKSYMCTICDMAFPSNYKLKRHHQAHSGEKPYRCDVCKKSFADKDYLEKHMRIHRGEKPHICNVCNAQFTHKSSLYAHSNRHTGKKPYECKICFEVFSSSAGLIGHSKRQHSGAKNSTEGKNKFDAGAKFCCENIPAGWKVKDSERTSDSEKPIEENSDCDAVVNSESKTEIESSSASAGRNTCEEIVDEKDEGSVGDISNFGKDYYSCKVCNRSFSKKVSLELHSQIHSKLRPYSCDTCQKSFTKKMNLKLHMLVHSNDEYPCYICGKPFKLLSSMKLHLLSHNELKSCNVCQKQLTVTEACKKIYVPSEQKTLYACEKCSSEFTHDKKFVVIPEIVNEPCSSKKSIMCNVCKRTFKNEILLDAHLDHYREKWHYSCEACQKTFVSERGFRAHAAVHTRKFLGYTTKNTFTTKAAVKELERKCNKCKKLIPLKATAVSTKNEDTVYTCKTCCKKSTTHEEAVSKLPKGRNKPDTEKCSTEDNIVLSENADDL
ncbi:hypothetical protein SK128_007001, partial [Halocaridina rubra]